MTLGFAAGLMRAGLTVRGTDAPAVSPGPRGGTDTTCIQASPLNGQFAHSLSDIPHSDNLPAPLLLRRRPLPYISTLIPCMKLPVIVSASLTSGERTWEVGAMPCVFLLNCNINPSRDCCVPFASCSRNTAQTMTHTEISA